MKSSAAWVVVAVAVLVAAIVAIFVFPFGQHRIDLYVTDHCRPFLVRTDEMVDTLVLRQNYLVTFLNRNDRPIEIVMPEGWFNLDRSVVQPGKYVLLEVIGEQVAETEYRIGNDCDGDPPRIRITNQS